MLVFKYTMRCRANLSRGALQLYRLAHKDKSPELPYQSFEDIRSLKKKQNQTLNDVSI